MPWAMSELFSVIEELSAPDWFIVRPEVILPLASSAMKRILPSNNKLASPFNPPDPSPVTTLLLASLERLAPAAAKDKTALPFVTSAWPLDPSEVGKLKAVPPEVIIILDPSEAIDSSASCNCRVGVPPSSVSFNPVSATWVSFISESAPNVNTAASDTNPKSSLIVASPVTANVDPSNVRLASASSSVVVEPTVTSSLAVALLSAVTAPVPTYVLISEAGICFVVVPSITINASALAIVIEDVDTAEPSNKLSSPAVEVTAVPAYANLPADDTLNVALSSIRATSVPSLCWNIISLASTTGLITTSLEELVILSISVPPARNLKSLPAASNCMSPAVSIIRSPVSLTI